MASRSRDPSDSSAIRAGVRSRRCPHHARRVPPSLWAARSSSWVERRTIAWWPRLTCTTRPPTAGPWPRRSPHRETISPRSGSQDVCARSAAASCRCCKTSHRSSATTRGATRGRRCPTSRPRAAGSGPRSSATGSLCSAESSRLGRSKTSTCSTRPPASGGAGPTFRPPVMASVSSPSAALSTS